MELRQFSNFSILLESKSPGELVKTQIQKKKKKKTHRFLDPAFLIRALRICIFNKLPSDHGLP